MKLHAIGFLAIQTLLAISVLNDFRNRLERPPLCCLQPSGSRRPSLLFQDSPGKAVSLKDYRGKVVLLDFWATWCHGCKLEIPWFAEFSRKYGDKGVVGRRGVAGFRWLESGELRSSRPPKSRIRSFSGNDDVAKAYGIENMPDTIPDRS